MAKHPQQERIVFEDNRLVPVLYGEQNAHLHLLENALDVEISNRGNELLISGPPAGIGQAREILESLWSRLQKGQEIDKHAVETALRFLQDRKEKKTAVNLNDDNPALGDLPDPAGLIVTKKKKLAPRTPTQAAYIKAMQSNNMVFGIGPAGTGKTYLAVAMAVSMMEAGRIERIILSRPAVEAGERLGFLPGELKEKMDPYLRPLYDALYDTMASDKVIRKVASEEIEIAPLAFMRGRTLNNAFIILDEAQNTTPMQMLMFLTRMGENSRMLITGDPSQTDLPGGQRSGLIEAEETLQGIDGIGFVRFTGKDVVRHPLVGKIIHAYDQKKKS